MLAVALAFGQTQWSGIRYLPTSGDRAAITIRSSNRTLDLSHLALNGSRSDAQETYQGVGVRLDHCTNLTLRGLTAHGYRINLLLDSCRNVRVEDADLDRSHAERILDPFGEPINSFLDLRELGAWKNYGAGIWLKDCIGCSVIRSHANDAMNGLIEENCRGIKVYDDDFAYNSAWGIALWGSEQSTVDWNHIDFCNRPWAGGWGGDAAALAVVSSSRNSFVGNSLTHGGDGFFLADISMGGWSDADQSLHEIGPSNDNMVAENDGSWSPHNAFEGTFSTGNRYLNNLADDCDYGFWLGYSSDSDVSGNEVFREAQDGIAIEHGRSNLLAYNSISDCKGYGVHLWSGAGPKDVAAPSADNRIIANAVARCGSWLGLLPGTIRTVVERNRHSGRAPEPILPNSVKKLASERPKGWQFYRDEVAPKGYEWIVAGDYAPRDSRVWAFAPQADGSYKIWLNPSCFNLLAPAWVGLAKMDAHTWFARVRSTDEVGEELSARLTCNSRGPRPRFHTVMLPLRTGEWNCQWFAWRDLLYTDRAGWNALFASRPAATDKLNRLDADWSYRSPIPGVLPTDHFALLATQRFRFENGSYRFSTLSDDGVRLFVDGREIISRWSHHGATPDSATIQMTAGAHDLRVEYCQEDGAAVLRVDWSKTPQQVSKNIESSW